MNDDFVEAVRRGDILTVKRLILEGRDVNNRDRWDATPIYYAALCGHNDVVKLLLEGGARVESGTVDGKRVWYSSLNLEIRYTLQNYKAKLMENLYSTFLSNALNNQDPSSSYSDIAFKSESKLFYAHRFMLKCQSPFFATELASRFKGQSVIPIKSKVPWQSTFAILSYMYTATVKIDHVYVVDLECLAKKFQLSDLTTQITRGLQFQGLKWELDAIKGGGDDDDDDVDMNGGANFRPQQQSPVFKIVPPPGQPYGKVQENILKLVQPVFLAPPTFSLLKGNGMNITSGLDILSLLQNNEFHSLNQSSHVPELVESHSNALNALLSVTEDLFCDIAISCFVSPHSTDDSSLVDNNVDDSNIANSSNKGSSSSSSSSSSDKHEQVAIFPCHKLFLHGRCDYFKTLLSGDFSESQSLRNLSNSNSNGSGGDNQSPNSSSNNSNNSNNNNNNNNNNNKPLAVIHLPHLSAKSLSFILMFLYTDEIPNSGPFEDLDIPELVTFLDASCSMLLPTLQSKIEVLICDQLNVENVCDILQISDVYSSLNLRNKCLEFMSRNYSRVSETEGFADLKRAAGESWSLTESEIRSSLANQGWK